jgi:hypothetical protein
MNKVERILRRAGRFVLGLKKFDRVKSAISSDLKWLFPTNKHEVLKIAFKFLEGNCPPYFYDYLTFDDSRIMITPKNAYFISNVNSTSVNKSFKFKAKQLWLGLPDDLANAESEYVFKTNKFFKLLLSEQIQQCQPSLLN